MGNCLRLGISRVGLAWSKWRMRAKFKQKKISLIILGMQAVGKSTIALRLYKFKRTLPDTNYVQTKGFNTFTVKKKKTTVHIYDLGGHPSIQELWDHYYADAHGVIFVVDTSDRQTVPEAGQLLSKVLSDRRIRGKPVLLLANKADLDGISESELDTMLNLQQLVNSVRCLTRLDVSCAIDLVNDKGIFEGFKWLVGYIESNYIEINNRVLSDTVEEKNREKARREAVKAERLRAAAEETSEPLPQSVQQNGTTTHNSTSIPVPNDNSPRTSEPVGPEGNREMISPLPHQVPPDSQKPAKSSSAKSNDPQARNISQNGNNTDQTRQSNSNEPPQPSSAAPRPISVTRLPVADGGGGPPSKIPAPLLPPINTNSSPFVDQPIKLPRLKSPKSKPEIINRIEDHGDEVTLVGESSSSTAGTSGGNVKGFLNSLSLSGPSNNNASSNDPYYNGEKGFKRISAARRLSPEGADSDDGIVNAAYEPSEDLSSDSTPIGTRKHNFNADSAELDAQQKEIFMVTTLAEVHKEYFKDRKGSTSTHDSISMSAVSAISEATTATDIMMDEGQTPVKLGNSSQEGGGTTIENLPTKSKGKSKKQRLGLKPKNKTAPLDQSRNNSANGSPAGGGTPIRNLPSIPPNKSRIPTAISQGPPNGPGGQLPQGKMPFTISSAWSSTENPPPEQMEMTSKGMNSGTAPSASGEQKLDRY